MRDAEMAKWFGPDEPIGDLDTQEAVGQLRAIGDETGADELAAATARGTADTYGVGDLVRRLFNRYVKTTNICGFLPATGADKIVPVTSAPASGELCGKPLKITLDGLHVASYPGAGRHSILFDFALQGQEQQGLKDQLFHFNARFQATDGETVPVHNFPLFLGVTPAAEGITFGFQTVNVSSSYNDGLLDFLNTDVFKTGMSLLSAAAPPLAQISEMAVGLTRWLASQSKNVKVQEFRQGLDFTPGRLGAGLALGTYIVAQIPLEYQNEWAWSDWAIDPNVIRLVARGATDSPLDFNHVMFGIRPLAQ